MEFIGEKTEDGVTRREFRLSVDGDTVPGVIWAPEGATGPRPLILLGHGGSQHKKVANLTAAAISNAQKLGYATLAIDAPGHGDRITREQAEKARAAAAFVAEEPRVTAAIFGLFGAFPGLEDHKAAAEAIRIPLMFVFQWEDELMTREQGLALFNAFGSTEKTMHINPGRHVEIPTHERDSWLAFWKRHLG